MRKPLLETPLGVGFILPDQRPGLCQLDLERVLAERLSHAGYRSNA